MPDAHVALSVTKSDRYADRDDRPTGSEGPIRKKSAWVGGGGGGGVASGTHTEQESRIGW